MRKKVEETGARQRPRRSFTPVFEAEVVALVRQGDWTAPTICREMISARQRHDGNSLKSGSLPVAGFSHRHEVASIPDHDVVEDAELAGLAQALGDGLVFGRRRRIAAYAALGIAG